MTSGLSPVQVRLLLEAVPDVVYVYDLRTRETRYVNSRWVTDFGYSLSDVREHGADFLASILHPDDVQRVVEHHAALATAADGETYSLRYRIRRKNGEYAWLESRDQPFERGEDGVVAAIVGVAREVTHEQKLEERRAEGEARFKAMIEHLPDAVFIASDRGTLVEVNATACDQLGRSRSELVGMNVRDFVAPEYHARLRESLQGGPRPFVESVHVRKDGTHVPVEVALVPLQLGGRPAMLGVARDVTARREAEARYREESELRAAIIENAVEGVCVGEEIVQAPGLRFTVWNQRMSEITGFTLAEINQHGWFESVYGDAAERERAAARLARAVGGEELSAEEWVIRRKDGSQRHVLVSARRLPTGGTPKLLGVFHDVTDRQRMQAQLRDAQRLESIGRLAGAVAHDFNNLLQAILGGSSLLATEPALSEVGTATLADVTGAAERAADLTRQLLTFSRRQRAEVRPLDLGAQVQETLRVARRLLGDTVRVVTDLSPACWVEGDPGMLDQVVMNLAVNARDAMPRGGDLTVSVVPAPPDGGPGGVLLVVKDDGVGIAPEALPHVFEPFFTTKPEGHGTGLGLATVYGIVVQHGGHARVDSAPGKGTTVTVWLPRARPVDVVAAPAPVPEPRSSLRVLVVDDQEVVRRIAVRLLQRLGHTSREAATATEALAALEEPGAPFDLVLTDVSLADGESGVDLATEIGRARPGMRVAFMSGYDEVLSRLPLVEGRDFIQKPFDLARLRELLAAQTGR